MRYGCILSALWLGLSIPAAADEQQLAKEKIVVKTSVQPREVREYRLDAAIKGKAVVPDSEKPVDIDASFALKVRHQYSLREGDGLLPLDISLTEGQVTVQGQKLEITPSLYPKLTVLIDRDWRVVDIFGLSGSRVAQTVPGINYGNHIILFYLQGADQPRTPGDTWASNVNLPTFGETYSFTNTLKGEQMVDGVRAAIVRQEISRPPRTDPDGQSTAMKSTADSAFAIGDGKLLKSHVECEVTFSKKGAAGKDPVTSRANIRIDISPVKLVIAK